jgi:hypothetical protein
MRDFDSFDKRFNRTRRFIKGAMVVQFIIIGIIVIGVIVGIIALINNPQAIGEFFGKIVNGFNSAK